MTGKPESNLKLFLRFLRFGSMAWGGPVAQIAMVKEELVEREKWVSPEQFNRALAVYQALPGPEAHELCVYLGTMRAGRVGGILAGIGFMLPGFLLMLLLTWVYVTYGLEYPAWATIFTGFSLGVLALIFNGVYKIGQHALNSRNLIIVGIFGFVGFLAGVSFWFVLPAAGLAAVLLEKKNYILLIIPVGIMAGAFFFKSSTSPIIEDGPIKRTVYPAYKEVTTTGLKAGLLTFGGAYTAIPLVREDVVKRYDWMTDTQFLDGIALGGIIPAPLIIFTTFTGYFGAGWLGALIITVAVFLPAFAFTLFGYKTIERLIEYRPIHAFLDGLTAALTGFIAITAFLLAADLLKNIQSLLIFAVSLGLILFLKTRLAVPMVMITAAAMAIVFGL